MKEKNRKYFSFDIVKDYSPEMHCRLTPTFSERGFSLEGLDWGDDVERVWGKDEYEYSFTLTPENTEKMFEAIGAEVGKEEEAIRLLLRGEANSNPFQELLGENGIEYKFWSY
jgi:hypothetical protein